LATAGLSIMYRGHAGQSRDTGRPYWQHCIEVAAEVHDALMHSPIKLRDRPTFIGSYIFRALGHDVIEDQEPAAPPGHPNYKPPFSLLQAYKIHEMTENPYAAQAVNTLRLMEYRSQKKQPWTEKTRDDYVDAIVDDPEAADIKDPDFAQNLAEPKPSVTIQEKQRWQKKEVGYLAGQQRIRQRARQDTERPWRAGYHDRIAENTRLTLIQSKVAPMEFFIFGREVQLAAA